MSPICFSPHLAEIAAMNVISSYQDEYQVCIRHLAGERFGHLQRHLGDLTRGKMKYSILFLFVLGLSACSPALPQNDESTPPPISPDTAVTSPPIDNMSTDEPMIDPFSPRPGDSKFTQGIVFISETDLVIRESFPPQISLQLRGELPTPCHQLRVKINEPDAQNKINVEAYSVVNPDRVCIQVVEPFEASIDLGTFSTGHYTVWLNGEMIGEFDS